MHLCVDKKRRYCYYLFKAKSFMRKRFSYEKTGIISLGREQSGCHKPYFRSLQPKRLQHRQLSSGVTADPRYTRITIVASGEEQILEQIEKQLTKLEDVVDIKKLEPGSSVTRELILVKIRAKDTERQPILNVTEIFHGKIVDVTHDSMVIELTGHQDKLEAFLDLLQGYDILELARTGITGLSRGTADVKIME